MSFTTGIWLEDSFDTSIGYHYTGGNGKLAYVTLTSKSWGDKVKNLPTYSNLEACICSIEIQGNNSNNLYKLGFRNSQYDYFIPASYAWGSDGCCKVEMNSSGELELHFGFSGSNNVCDNLGSKIVWAKFYLYARCTQDYFIPKSSNSSDIANLIQTPSGNLSSGVFDRAFMHTIVSTNYNYTDNEGEKRKIYGLNGSSSEKQAWEEALSIKDEEYQKNGGTIRVVKRGTALMANFNHFIPSSSGYGPGNYYLKYINGVISFTDENGNQKFNLHPYMRRLLLAFCGGGGGGGGNPDWAGDGAGGAGAGTVFMVLNLNHIWDSSNYYYIHIGSGGSGGSNGNSGSAGGDSWIAYNSTDAGSCFAIAYGGSGGSPGGLASTGGASALNASLRNNVWYQVPDIPYMLVGGNYYLSVSGGNGGAGYHNGQHGGSGGVSVSQTAYTSTMYSLGEAEAYYKRTFSGSGGSTGDMGRPGGGGASCFGNGGNGGAATSDGSSGGIGAGGGGGRWTLFSYKSGGKGGNGRLYMWGYTSTEGPSYWPENSTDWGSNRAIWTVIE